MKTFCSICMSLLLSLNAFADTPAALAVQQVQRVGEHSSPLRPGEEIRVKALVVNSGDKPAAGAVVRFRSAGGNWGELRTRQTIPPGGQLTLEGKLSSPEKRAMTADANGLFEWSTQVSQAILPDLVIDRLTLQGPSASQGQASPVEVAVRNAGEAAAPAVQVTVRAAGQAVGQPLFLDELKPGEKKVGTVSWLPPKNSLFELEATVDTPVEEVSADNNQAHLSVEVIPRSAALRLSGLTYDVDEPQVGRPMKFQFTVTNPGEQDVHKVPVSLRFDDQEVAAKTYFETIPAKGGSLDFYLPYVPKQPGRHRATLVMSGAAPAIGKGATPGLSLNILDRTGFVLLVQSCDLPDRVQAGQDRLVTLTVVNKGDQVAQDVHVYLVVNGERAAGAKLEGNLGPRMALPVSFHWTPPATLKSVELLLEAQGGSTRSDRQVSKPVKVELAK